MADNTTTTDASVASGGQSPGIVSAADVADALQNPASFSVEGLSQSNRSMSEYETAWKLSLKMARAGRRRHPLAGIGIAQVVPPGP